MEVISIPIIAAIVYAVAELLKTTINNEKFNNYLPLVCAGLGILLAVVAFYVSPGIILADDILQAIFLGLASGLTATGSNQIVKQMKQLLQSSDGETLEDNSEEDLGTDEAIDESKDGI